MARALQRLRAAWQQYWSNARRLWQPIFEAFRGNGSFDELRAQFTKLKVHRWSRRLVRDPSDAPRAAAGLHISACGHMLGRHACALRGSASDGAAWPCRRRISLDLRRRSGCMQVSSAADGKTLAFNALKDPCPWLTKKQVEFCKGFDYGDIERRKTTRLWPSMPSRTLALRSPRSGLSSARDSITRT